MSKTIAALLTSLIFYSCKTDHSITVFAGLKIATPLKDFRQSTRSEKFREYNGHPYYTFVTENGKWFYGVPCTWTDSNRDSIVWMMSIYVSQSVEQIPNLVKEMHNERLLANNLLNSASASIASENEIYTYLRNELGSKYKKSIEDTVLRDDLDMMEYLTFFEPAKSYFIRLDRYVDHTIPQNDTFNPSGCIVITYTVDKEYLKRYHSDKVEKTTSDDF